jgi:hypothetical protein
MGEVLQLRTSESISENGFNIIAHSMLRTVSGNQTGALGMAIMADVQRETGCELETVGKVFDQMGTLRVIERSKTDLRAGIVLTEVGEELLKHFDELKSGQEQKPAPHHLQPSASHSSW